MSNIRFLHTADLHLDCPFVGLANRAPANVTAAMREATFAAWDRIVDLAVTEAVDAVLIAGDVYDFEDRSLRAQRRFADGIWRLDRNGIRSLLCHGNHDPLSGWQAQLALPDSCYSFGAEISRAPLSLRQPDRATVYGISFPAPQVFDNLAHKFTSTDGPGIGVGLLHCSTGQFAEDQFAPCTLDDLTRVNVAYWALGHIHHHHVLSKQAPAIVYPGVPQARDLGEAGAKGACLVEIDDHGRVNLQFRQLDSIRLLRLPLDIADIDNEQELIERLRAQGEEQLTSQDGRSVIGRFELFGRGPLHGTLQRPGFADDLREAVNDDLADRVPFFWCERIEIATRAEFDRRGRLQGADFVSELLRVCDGARADLSVLEGLSGELDDLRNHRLGRLIEQSEFDENAVSALLESAEDTAINILLGDD